MFIKHTQFSSLRVSGILEAGTSAIRAIPPAFPLDATVAVNPFLGQVGEGLAEASARLARTSGTSLTRPRSS
ncbi:putative inorganic carbon transporter subunit DabA, partial [Roseibium sp.]|uniref:putative inorganic carbon transporter subunit DabA n=1 Tax=Roseibium sp. TaxID=1936156 RepID=UPI003517AE98